MTAAMPRNAADLALALQLRRARRIFLRNFETRVSMGVHDFEKRGRQRVLVNVDLYLEPEGKIRQDSIAETVDYDFLRVEIQQLADSGHFHLQETFCESILAACLARPGVIAVRVSSEKPDVYPDCEAVGFEVFRLK